MRHDFTSDPFAVVKSKPWLVERRTENGLWVTMPDMFFAGKNEAFRKAHQLTADEPGSTYRIRKYGAEP